MSRSIITVGLVPRRAVLGSERGGRGSIPPFDHTRRPGVETSSDGVLMCGRIIYENSRPSEVAWTEDISGPIFACFTTHNEFDDKDEKYKRRKTASKTTNNSTNICGRIGTELRRRCTTSDGTGPRC